MTVYVDEPRDYGDLARLRGLRHTVWAHMTADTRDELHEMAERIGLRRSWFQDHPRRWHYDVTPAKRNAALRFGAQAITARELARITLARRDEPTTSRIIAAEKPVPVLYLDLDGTVRHGKDELGRFVNGPKDVVVFPEAVEMMRRWKRGGGRIIGVSNQGGIALGHLSARACGQAMTRTWELTERLFDKIAWCSHHPAASDPEMARCWCRKPSPGLLIEAAIELARACHEFYPPYMGLMVGDRDEDAECARLAGLDFQWAHEWRAQAGTSTGTVVP